MDAPPKEKRDVQAALLTDSKLAKYYRARRSFQASVSKCSIRGHSDRRECVCCSARVTNRSLGGFSGRSASENAQNQNGLPG